ncbi:c-type cytochrome [Roseomonas rosulenta]|uniref:c-type cytochrome n=1 Tax=Roseomonas rosulenta TaxID=2748667 RepID=UPI001E41C6AD|nr:c-type cytochrome [Roseomonas rosulenta]
MLALLLALPAAAQDQGAVHGGPVRALAVAPGGGALASAGFDQSVIFWDLASGRARAVVRWHAGAVNALVALPGGGLASGGEDGRIAIWPADPRAGEPLRVLDGHDAPVAGLAWHDGVLASAAWDGTVRLWREGAAPRVLEGHRGNVNAVVFRADGVPVSAGFDGTLRAWRQDGTADVLAEFGLPRNALAALPDGGLAVGGVDGAVHVLTPDGAVREVFSGSRPIAALAANAAGTLLAAAGLGGSVAVIGLPEGRLLRTLDGPGTPVWSAAFDTDGRTLWTGGADRRVRRWDAVAGRALGPVGDAGEPALREGLDPHGARVFRACSACHALSAEGGNMAGPHLHGLFGRRMGSVAGYTYSERLARGDIVWTPESVADLFTRGPDVVTPGTKMPVQRVENAEDLAALLRFLEQATR